MRTYSPSKLGTYEQCPQKYKFRYVDRIKAEREFIEAFMGSRIHQALQKLYADFQLSKLNTLEELIACYEHSWNRNFHPQIEVVRADLNPQNYLDSGKQMLRSYYRRFYPFNQELTTDLELPVSFPITDGVMFGGVIDRVAKVEEGNYVIHDYKSSRRLPSQAQIEEDRQLPLYEIAIRHRWPDARKVTLVWHFLASETELQARKTREELDHLKSRTAALIEEIERTREFPTRESPLCDWCEYYNACPAKKHECKVETLPPTELKLESGVSLVDRYVALKEQAKEAEKRTKEELAALEAAILEYAEKTAVSVVVGSTKKVRIREREVTSLPTKSSDPAGYEQVARILRSAGHWEDISSLDYHATIRALRSGQFSQEVASKLQNYLKQEIRKTLSISRRQGHDRD